MDNETYGLLRSTVRRFVNERLIPAEDQVEREDAVPEDIVADMRDMGLFGLTVPEAYGGLGLNVQEEAGIIQELCRAALAFRSVIGTTVGIGSQGISTFIRPSLQWQPTDELDMILRYEYFDGEADSPAAQSHTNGSGVPGAFVNFDRDSHKFSQDETGYSDGDAHFLSFELNWNVGDEGTITNIFGYRESTIDARLDVDAQPIWLFHAPAWVESEQYSNELRYNTVIADRANVTTGVYYFTNEIENHERRELLGVATGNVAPAAQLDGGGLYEVETYAAFGAVDFDLSDTWVLTAGLRYTYEEKEAHIASLSKNINNPCNIVEPSASEPVCDFDFVDSDDWSSWSPKLGVTWLMSEDTRLYAHWTRGYRSGGYNLRNTSFDPADTPGPFDEEQVDNYEVGYKASFGRGRLNAALFYNQIEDMQRELNLPSQGAGSVQLVRNTADATILGFEVDGSYALTDNLFMMASIGWLDPQYDEVFFDLNGDGVIDGDDENLDLPRAAELTYSLSLNHSLEIGSWGYLDSRVSYSYRDESAYTDDNLGYILEQERLDAGLDLHTNDGHWIFSLYGRNLTDEVLHGADAQLPDDIGGVPTGGTFAPLSKGRIYGAEVTFNF